jgi:hypothetical protein
LVGCSVSVVFGCSGVVGPKFMRESPAQRTQSTMYRASPGSNRHRRRALVPISASRSSAWRPGVGPFTNVSNFSSAR